MKVGAIVTVKVLLDALDMSVTVGCRSSHHILRHNEKLTTK